MKRITLTLTISFFLTTLFAQNWAPVGSKWYYSNVSWGFPFSNNPRVIESIGDTIINGKSCRTISGYCDCGFFTIKTYMYFENNKLFLFNDTTNNFHVLYDFSAGIGETWTIVPPNPVDSFKVIVDTVYSREINDVTYNIQYIYNLNHGDSWEFSGEVAEGIGNITYCFFPAYATCDPYTGPLRCYDDTQIIKYFGTIPCDTTIYSISINEYISNNLMQIYPNPANEYITIETSDITKEQTISIYNVQGQLLLQQPMQKAKSEMNISNLAKGLYIIKLTTADRFAVKKFIKE